MREIPEFPEKKGHRKAKNLLVVLLESPPFLSVSLMSDMRTRENLKTIR